MILFLLFLGVLLALWRAWGAYFARVRHMMNPVMDIPDTRARVVGTSLEDTMSSQRFEEGTFSTNLVGQEILPSEHSGQQMLPLDNNEQGTSPPRQFTNALNRLTELNLKDTILCMAICILGGLAISYLEAVRGGVLGQDYFLQKLSDTLFLEKKHQNTNNYCAFFDIRLQLTIATAHITKILAMLIARRICVWWGKKPTLIASIILTSIGVILSIAIQKTSTIVSGFFIQSIGIGLAYEAIHMIRTCIAPDTCTTIFDVALLFGAPPAHLIIYITSHHKWGWRASLACAGIVGLPLLIISSILTVPHEEEPPLKPSFQSLQKPKCRPPLFIGLLYGTLSLFSAVGTFQFFGPLLFSSSGVKLDRAVFLPPLVISVLQLFFGLISIYFISLFGRRWLLLLASIAKVISELVISIDFYKKSDPMKYYRSSRVFYIAGAIYVGGDSILRTPASWLEISFSKDAQVAGSIIGAMLGPLSDIITASLSILAFCELKNVIFFLFLSLHILITAFVLLLVPETTNARTFDIARNVWSQHWFWRRYVTPNDMY